MAKESGRPTPITTLSPRLVPQPGDDARTESTPAQNTIKVTFFSDFLLGKTRIQGFTTGSPSLGIWGSGAGLRRKREKLQGSVTSVTHKMGLRVKWGGTSAIERGQGLCFSHGLPPPPLTMVVGCCPVKKGAGQAQFHSTGPVCIQWIDTDEEVQHNGWITSAKIDPPQNTYTQPKPCLPLPPHIAFFILLWHTETMNEKELHRRNKHWV